jgi:hypothetical protein
MTMDALALSIQHPNGRREEILVEAAEALIGSGAHCDVRLPPEHARFEHVVVRSGPAGLSATSKTVKSAPKLNGVEFMETRLDGQSVLDVGGVRITIAPTVAETRDAKPATSKKGISPVTLLFAVVGIAAAGAMYLSKPRAESGMTQPTAVPDLFTESTTCPQTAAPQANAVADGKLALANAKRERSPFHVQDGVAAVSLYKTAASCFRIAGRSAEAAAADHDAQALRARITEDFRVQRVRLERALTIEDWRGARKQVRALLAYTEQAPGEYASWLSITERKLRTAEDKAKKEE